MNCFDAKIEKKEQLNIGFIQKCKFCPQIFFFFQTIFPFSNHQKLKNYNILYKNFMNFIRCLILAFLLFCLHENFLVIFNDQCNISSSLPLQICNLNDSFLNNFQFQYLDVQLNSDLYIKETLTFENLEIKFQ